ncbi:MAG: hypothetical protein CME62_17080 [Halobacteriovoraceae bacterium]|nr:hypothetical protein [Halobacteriovoraceae bacterium]
MLLPITDTAGNSFGYKIFELLEAKLTEEKWCEYQSSSDVIGIFSKYRDKLSTYLRDENVLKTVADRLKVGTIIRVSLEYEVDKINVEMTVIGENGKDIYLQEKALLNEVNEDLVMTTLGNWLELYESSIPYDGKVVGVLGEQVTFTVPGHKNVSIGQDFIVKRLISKKRHPLLKKVVEWDNIMLAKGKVFNKSSGQGLGIIKVYTTNRRVNTGDWIKLEKVNPNKIIDDKRFEEEKANTYGKLGELTIAFSLGSHTASTSAVSGNNKMAGLIYGINLEAEAWMTRNYFAIGEFSRQVGNLDSQSGSPDSDTSGQNSGTFKIGGGYKYLPMGFFYGPQVNLYGGWVKYSYQLDKSATDGFGTNSISGFFLGVGGSIPLQKTIRVFGSGEILPFGDFNDEDNIFGSTDAVSSMAFEAGVHYYWSPLIKIVGAFEVLNNSAKTGGSNSEVSYRDTSLKFGGVFTF